MAPTEHSGSRPIAWIVLLSAARTASGTKKAKNAYNNLKNDCGDITTRGNALQDQSYGSARQNRNKVRRKAVRRRRFS